MKYIFLFFLIIITSCDDDNKSDSQPINESIDIENLYGEWHFYLEEYQLNQCANWYSRNDSINIKNDGSLEWMGSLENYKGISYFQLSNSSGSWNYDQESKIFSLYMQADIHDEKGLDLGKLDQIYSGKLNIKADTSFILFTKGDLYQCEDVVDSFNITYRFNR